MYSPVAFSRSRRKRLPEILNANVSPVEDGRVGVDDVSGGVFFGIVASAGKKEGEMTNLDGRLSKWL